MTRWFALALLALTAACSGAEPSTADPIEPPAAVEIWLPASSPAFEAQAAWGLPLTCELTVELLSLADLQNAFGGPPADGTRWAHADGCTLTLAPELLAPEQSSIRAMVLAHEFGHVLAYAHGRQGHLAVSDGCPTDAAGRHLMCAGGDEALTPSPDAVDYAFVLGE
jgi:hypothetical protein